MLLSRYRAHGLLGMSGGQSEIWYRTGRTAADRYRLRDELIANGELVPVAVEGIRGPRLALASEVDLIEKAAGSTAVDESAGGGAPGVAFLAPLDPFAWDRDLLRSLFDFDYVWEVYVPAARRRWGYYVLPLLWGDRLVGRIEPRIDRATGTLRILGLWWEDGFDPVLAEGFAEAFTDALTAHARFGGSRRITWPRVERHRKLGGEVRDRLGPRGAVRA